VQATTIGGSRRIVYGHVFSEEKKMTVVDKPRKKESIARKPGGFSEHFTIVKRISW
jgi:hypothetical protein